MENIVKETLQKQLDDERDHLAALVETKFEDLTQRTKSCIENIIGRKLHHVKIDKEQIQIFFTNDFCDDFSIYHRQKWVEENKYIFQEPTLSWRGVSEASDKDIDRLCIISDIAKLKRDKHRYFDNIISFMQEFRELDNKEFKPLRNKIYELEDAIKDQEQNERSNIFEKILKRGWVEIPLPNKDSKSQDRKPLVLYYGASKWDKEFSRRFEWTQNEGKKTYSAKYLSEVFERNEENEDVKVVSSKMVDLHNKIRFDNLKSTINEAIRLGAE